MMGLLLSMIPVALSATRSKQWQRLHVEIPSTPPLKQPGTLAAEFSTSLASIDLYPVTALLLLLHLRCAPRLRILISFV